MPKGVPRVKKDTAPKVEKPKFTVTVLISGEKHIGHGNTISEALADVKIATFKSKAIIKVSDGKVERQVMFMPSMMRKLVMPINRQFLEKRMEALLR